MYYTVWKAVRLTCCEFRSYLIGLSNLSRRQFKPAFSNWEASGKVAGPSRPDQFISHLILGPEHTLLAAIT